MTDEQPPLIDDAFTMWINRPSRDAKHMGNSGAIIKKGRGVTKTIAVTKYGDKKIGDVRKRELRFRTYEHRRDGQPDYDEKNPKNTWFCENDEIERVLAFLQSEVARTGKYRIVDASSPAGVVLDLLKSSDADAHDLAAALLLEGDLKNLVSALSASARGHSIAELAVIEARRQLISDLQALISIPNTTETDLQRRIGDSYWLFGGRYVGTADRRNLMPLDQHDIPLLGADGTLHIVELKGPRISKLIRRHRNHWIVAEDVNEAVGQAMNYVRAFDELGASISEYHRRELGYDYDMRRVFATVLIGDAENVMNPRSGQIIDARAVRATIRSYNSHLSRIEVRTYDELLDTAKRALNFENESRLSSAALRDDATLDTDNHSPSRGSEEPWSDDPPF
jgi:hypothetical protein